MVATPDFTDRLRRLGVVVVDPDATLPNARRLVVGSGLAVVDGGPGGDLTLSTTGGLVVVSNVLGANVPLVAFTWVAGPSVLLTPGTWLVHAYLTAETVPDTGVTFVGVAAKVWDGGTSEIAAGESSQTTSQFQAQRDQIAMTGIVVVAADTTYTLAVKAVNTIASGAMKALVPSGGSTGPATGIHALRIS